MKIGLETKLTIAGAVFFLGAFVGLESARDNFETEAANNAALAAEITLAVGEAVMLSMLAGEVLAAVHPPKNREKI